MINTDIRSYDDYVAYQKFAELSIGHKMINSRVWTGLKNPINDPVDFLERLNLGIILAHKQHPTSSKMAKELSISTPAAYPYNSFVAVVKRESTVGLVEITTVSMKMTLSSIDDDLEAIGIISSISDAMIDYTKVESNEVKINFSFLGDHGKQDWDRWIVCPKWAEIKANYVNNAKIESLINIDNPDEKGKLIFWYGAPGTGKTYAIRALMREWKDKASFTYILDPERFFGNANYMLESLLNSEAYEPRMPGSDQEDKMRLLIVEDGLTILLSKNRDEMASQTARLLNLTEGMIGQGMNVIILITANQQITEIDPAFLRPGRCLQKLEFAEFTKNDAIKWASAHGFSLEDYKDDKFTLSTLYAIMNNNSIDLSPIDNSIKIGGFR